MKVENCAARLKKAMEQRGIKQVELCRITGIPKSAMSQYLKGSFEPKQDRLRLLAEALGVSAAWLQGYELPMCPTYPDGEDILTPLMGNTRMVPLYESVAAGFGCYAANNIVDYLPLLIQSDDEAARTICLKVSGDSMYPKIENGDVIVVQKQDSVDVGCIGVFLIDNEEGVVKKVNYTYGEDWLELISLNPDFMPRRFEGAEVERVKTLGLVRQVIKNI